MYRKISYGFCIMIMHHLTHRCLCVSFLAKNNTVIMPQPMYSPRSSLGKFCYLPKTEDSDERKTFCYDWGNERKIETRAVKLTKRAFQNRFEDWKKRWHKYIISKDGYFEGDKIVIDKWMLCYALVHTTSYIHNWSLQPLYQDYDLTHFIHE